MPKQKKYKSFNDRKTTPGRPTHYLPLYSGKTLEILLKSSQFNALPSYEKARLLRRMIRLS